MSSKSQKRKGYPLPTIIRPDGQLHFCITIPEDPAYYMAMYAQLVQLGKWWHWKRDDDSRTKATETALMWRETFTLSENCGGFPVTPEEFYDANKRSIYDAINDVAKQIVSGRVTNIAVGDDGTVSDPTTGAGDAALPEDDPETLFNETKGAKMGVSLEIGKAIEYLLDKVDSLYGNTNGSPTTDEADAQTYIKALFPTDGALMDTAISNYYAWRATNGRIIFDASTGYYTFLYCHGNSEAALRRYFIEQSTYDIDKATIVNDLIVGLSEEFFSFYSQSGIEKPSTLYFEAPCEPTQDQSMTAIPFNTNIIGTPLKASHRLKFHIEGYYTDPDGDLQDAFWYRTSAGVLTRKHPDILQQGNILDPTDQQVVYRSDHIYDYTVDSPSLGGFYSVQFFKDGGMAAGSTSPTGGFTVNLHDLGQYGAS